MTLAGSLSRPMPWQATQWSQIYALLSAGRMPHALLLHGPGGCGKRMFAECVAAALLCESTEQRPCGSCRGCTFYGAGTHPDRFSLSPEEGKQDISVAAVRVAVERAQLTRQYADYRAIIVEPADAMNVAAANALLKTLEEPTPGTVFLLVSSRPHALLATIRSRCHQMRFPPPSTAEAEEWLVTEGMVESSVAQTLLEAAQGAPLRALGLHAEGGLEQRAEVDNALRGLLAGRLDPLAAARGLAKLPLDDVLYWMQLRANDLVRRAGLGEVRLDSAKLYYILDEVSAARKVRARRGNPNAQLLLESLAIAWARDSSATMGAR